MAQAKKAEIYQYKDPKGHVLKYDASRLKNLQIKLKTMDTWVRCDLCKITAHD